MVKTSLMEVHEEKLSTLLIALGDVIDDICEAEPDLAGRDATYYACLMMGNEVMQALKWHELNK